MDGVGKEVSYRFNGVIIFNGIIIFNDVIMFNGVIIFNGFLRRYVESI